MLGMMLALALLEGKVRAKPNRLEGIACLAAGLPAAFIGYHFAVSSDDLVYGFTVMAATGAVISLIPVLAELFDTSR